MALANPVNMQPISSSCVSAAGYDEYNQILIIDFIKTGVYTYFNVKPDMYKAFMDSESKGAFVNKVFKQSNWPYQKGTVDPIVFEAPLE